MIKSIKFAVAFAAAMVLSSAFARQPSPPDRRACANVGEVARLAAVARDGGRSEAVVLAAYGRHYKSERDFENVSNAVELAYSEHYAGIDPDSIGFLVESRCLNPWPRQ